MFNLPPPDPAFEIVLASRGMSKGITQTEGPQIVAKPSLRVGDLQVGAQWKNVSSRTAKGEAALFVNGSRELGSLHVSAGAAYKFQTGVRGPTDSASWEFNSVLSRKFGPVTARVIAIYSPNDLGRARKSLFVEGGPSVQLRQGWSVSAAAGRRSRRGGVDYTAWHAGVSKAIKLLQLDMRYYGTNRSEAGEIYKGRIVGSIRFSF
ncbi:MAG: hypothetical protein ABI454_00930 [Sphingomicrobium sp.]